MSPDCVPVAVLYSAAISAGAMTVITVSAYAWLAQSKKYQLFRAFLFSSLIALIVSFADRPANSSSVAVATSDIMPNAPVRLIN